jgi:hypothetical protein
MSCFLNSPPSEKHLLDRNIQDSIPINLFSMLVSVAGPGN